MEERGLQALVVLALVGAFLWGVRAYHGTGNATTTDKGSSAQDGFWLFFLRGALDTGPLRARAEEHGDGRPDAPALEDERSPD